MQHLSASAKPEVKLAWSETGGYFQSVFKATTKYLRGTLWAEGPREKWAHSDTEVPALWREE